MVGLVFIVGSGVLVELGGRGSLVRGRSRVPDLRERGGDKDAMLERSSSSGLIVAIFCRKKFRIVYTDVRLEKVIRMCVFVGKII